MKNWFTTKNNKCEVNEDTKKEYEDENILLKISLISILK